MCNKANLHLRVTKAKAAQHFISVSSRDNNGLAISFYVTGSNAKLYHVILRRKPSLTTELHLVVGDNLTKTLISYRTLTYHAMAVVMYAAKESGYRVQWCANESDATNLSNLGGTKFRLGNFDNDANEMWGVYFNDR